MWMSNPQGILGMWGGGGGGGGNNKQCNTLGIFPFSIITVISITKGQPPKNMCNKFREDNNQRQHKGLNYHMTHYDINLDTISFIDIIIYSSVIMSAKIQTIRVFIKGCCFWGVFFNQIVLIFFLLLHKKTHCGYTYSLEASNKHPQHIFFLISLQKCMLWVYILIRSF